MCSERDLAVRTAGWSSSVVLNTLISLVIIMTVVSFMSGSAGDGLAKLQFPGKHLHFNDVLISLITALQGLRRSVWDTQSVQLGSWSAVEMSFLTVSGAWWGIGDSDRRRRVPLSAPRSWRRA